MRHLAPGKDIRVNVNTTFAYGTALVYENGEVHFSDDIYGHDAVLARALARGIGIGSFDSRPFLIQPFSQVWK